MFPPGKESQPNARLHNCFRLPPSDHLAQAPAVSVVARKVLKAKKCVILGDSSPGAVAYSAPLFDDVLRVLDPICLANATINRNTQAFQRLVANLTLDPPDVIIFCGYGSTAIKLLTALRTGYAGIDAP